MDTLDFSLSGEEIQKRLNKWKEVTQVTFKESWITGGVSSKNHHPPLDHYVPNDPVVRAYSEYYTITPPLKIIVKGIVFDGIYRFFGTNGDRIEITFGFIPDKRVKETLQNIEEHIECLLQKIPTQFPTQFKVSLGNRICAKYGRDGDVQPTDGDFDGRESKYNINESAFTKWGHVYKDCMGEDCIGPSYFSPDHYKNVTADVEFFIHKLLLTEDFINHERYHESDFSYLGGGGPRVQVENARIYNIHTSESGPLNLKQFLIMAQDEKKESCFVNWDF